MLRRVREGREREFHSSTREVVFHRPMAMMAAAAAQPAGQDLVLKVNTELTQAAQQELAANVGEPSVAANGDVVFYTGNWYAARSIDGGRTFTFVDPSRSFPNPANLVFCCDQVVNYIPSIDTFVWLLQYGTLPGAPESNNIQRLAFAKTADVVKGKWRLFDITTRALGVPSMFLDFPDLAVGANSLYVTTNIFTPDRRGAGAAVVRIPFNSIDKPPVKAAKFVSAEFDSFRVAQNCGTHAFFATHNDTSTLAVFTWNEGAAQPQPQHLVPVARWIAANGYHSRCPDGRTWLDRADPRITGATLAGNELYFTWAVDAGSNQRPQPFVQAARIDATNLTLLENINVFDSQSATCYGALSTNADGEVGISYMLGGGPRFPTHVVGILTAPRKDLIVAASDRGPLPDPKFNLGEWGDYVTVRPYFPDRKFFAATGYTMKGATGSNRQCTPRFVLFGRANVAGGIGPSVITPVGPAPVPATPPPAPPEPPSLSPTPVPDGVAIHDVNTLAVVSAAVAAKIKKAAGMPGQLKLKPMAEPMEMPMAAPEADSPGSERWPVKTGQDADRAKVGKNILLTTGEQLGPGIVEATIEELINLPRPKGLENIKADPPQFSNIRDGQAEVTIWRIEALIIGVKHEKDGDYHLVLQSNAMKQMVAEIPTPTTVFVGDSPWLDNIREARRQVDDKIVKHLSPADFTLLDDKFVPHSAMKFDPGISAPAELSFVTPPEDSAMVQPLFQAAVKATAARITGIGFFDRSHGATGAAPNVIELHPVLKIEWL
jgi:hypothetical protein